MQAGPLHELMKPLCWLIGTWKSVCGVVSFPTMKTPKNYCEILSFVSYGQPTLNYWSETWEAETKQPWHLEGGYMRVAEDKCTVYFFTAQSLGLVALEVGKVKGNCITLYSSCIPQTKFVPREVVHLVRRYSLNEDGQLEYLLKMETVKTPLVEHARAIYNKAC